MKTIHSFWKMAVVMVAFFAAACSNEENDITTTSSSDASEEMMREAGNNPDDEMLVDVPTVTNYRGFVYTAGNGSGANKIYIYRYDQDGNLTYQDAVASGGTGTGMQLESQGALAISEDKRYLFAVNAGSNSISSFEIDANGGLLPLHTAASGGIRPVSLTIHQNILYVVHMGNNTINGFTVAPDGKMTPIPNSARKLSTQDVAPAQISFAPSGRHLYITEKKTDRISIFTIDNTGAPGQITVTASVGDTPFGFDFARDNYMIVSNAHSNLAGASSATAYHGVENGVLANVNGAVANGQTASCWVATSKHGRYAYVTNTLSNNISSYYIDRAGKLLLTNARTGTGDSPIDIGVSLNNYNVFVLSASEGSIRAYVRAPFGNLTYKGLIRGIPDAASGLAIL